MTFGTPCIFNRQGYPVANMHSRSESTDKLQLFYSQFLIKVGKISPRIFMSDMTECLFTSWKLVMSPNNENNTIRVSSLYLYRVSQKFCPQNFKCKYLCEILINFDKCLYLLQGNFTGFSKLVRS